MPNRLSQQTSPYLLQHANNPVDWYPWAEEALQLARTSGKPILLSIGYSACHWCHVMAHESFEDEATAELMNKLFINIKVDREERPDLDKIYQTAHQILTQRPGGWPLTLFLRPDNQMPFFAGTYFPREPRGGMITFKELMQRINNWYREHPEELQEQNRQLDDILLKIAESESGDTMPDIELIEKSVTQLKNAFDSQYGGFGKAPKFPHPTNLERLLRYHYKNPSDNNSLHIAAFTLQQMALGGMNDQIGGGFCRYSVDDRWEIPHFEKMLYDNGPLLALYAQAYSIDKNPLFLHTCKETADWVMCEMQSPQGGYYSSLDADTEGEEGKFYTWTQDEIRAVLDDNEYAVISYHYGLNRPANFEGKWNPHVYMDIEDIVEEINIETRQVSTYLDSARRKLFSHREKRVKPGRDEKILTSWNALMIKGMAIAARLCKQPEWGHSAQRAVDFIHDTLWQDGRLLATCKDSKAHLNAYLDDYSYLIDALLELLQFEWRNTDVEFARQLADILLESFEDKRHGGFFFTSDDHEDLIQRPKPYTDDAMPSGNGIAAYALQRLGNLLGNSRYLQATERCLQAAGPSMAEQTWGCTSMLLALEEFHQPVNIIVLRGEPENLKNMLQQLADKYHADYMIFAISAQQDNLPESLTHKSAAGEFTAYLCRGATCGPPYHSLTDLIHDL